MGDQAIIKSIKKILIDKDLIYKDLAAILGVSEGVVKNYMIGKTAIPTEHLITLSHTWGVPFHGIIGQETLASEPENIYRKGQAGRNAPTNSMVRLRTQIAAMVDELGEGVFEIFEVEGASMETSLSQGDRLICKMISLDNLVDGRIHVLVVDRPDLNEKRKSRIWVKRCYNRKEKGYISCRSDNHDTTEPFSTIRLNISDIIELWYPVLKISGQMADPNRDLYEQVDELRSRIEFIEAELNLENQ